MTSEPSQQPGGKARRTAPDAPPVQVRAAAAVVGLEGLVGLGAAVVFGVASEGGLGDRIGEASYFVLLGGALVLCAVLLWRGKHGARTPSIVTQLLLVPFVYSQLAEGRLAIGVVALLLVVGTFLLLVSEPARRWSMGADERSRAE
ncbi:hypothetical protein GCM10010472_62130 [Pseudonocardia halophobica]|uniref:Integral membrane protein n=1 Tax=Pseudonocardia halophobica TaxID=29401 RepID=A0A9W6NZL4_9PSEU|nr:hypothetical protein [Pseudonocardia halophobica]GLL15103.1 hypothetical protein GCM10017577_62520 [Pseudonocardia halophobica]